MVLLSLLNLKLVIKISKDLCKICHSKNLDEKFFKKTCPNCEWNPKNRMENQGTPII